MMVRKKFNVWFFLKVFFIVVTSFLFILPLWLTLTASFESSMSFTKNGYSLIIHEFSAVSYEKLFGDKLFWSSFFNSFWVTIVTVVLSVVVNTLTAYVLHKKEIPFHKALNIIFVITLFFNAGMIPTYLVIKGLGMTDSFLALTIPPVLGVYNIILIRNYLYSLPTALEEAALIDGANHFQVLWSVIVPISKPIIITTALMILIAKWNSWMDIMLYISKTEEGRKFWTVQYYLRYLREAVDAMNVDSSGNVLQSEQILAASIIITVLPVALLFPMLQKYFANGIAVGAVKG